MLLLVVAVIALGWLALAITWGRDRFMSGRGRGSSSSVLGQGRSPSGVVGRSPSGVVGRSPSGAFGRGLPSLQGSGAKRSGPSRFGAPTTAEMARVRRQQVLVGLVMAAIVTFFLTRLWPLLWALHILVDIALIAFAVAMYMRAANAQRKSQPDADRYVPAHNEFDDYEDVDAYDEYESDVAHVPAHRDEHDDYEFDLDDDHDVSRPAREPAHLG